MEVLWKFLKNYPQENYIKVQSFTHWLEQREESRKIPTVSDLKAMNKDIR